MQVSEIVLQHAQTGNGLAGSLFWSAVGSLLSDSDDFSVHLVPPAAPDLVAESSTPSPPQAGRGDEATPPESSESLPGSGAAAEDMPETHLGGSDAGSVPSEKQGKSQSSKEPVWLDKAVVEVVRAHAKSIAALNSSWGDCPLM